MAGDRYLRTVVTAAMGSSAVSMAYQVASRATRDTLYLSNFHVSSLPSMVAASAVLFAVIALRGLTNERSEFLITTLPVAELSAAMGRTVVFPHFADGGGWTTQLILVNPTDSTLTGTFYYYVQSGQATDVDRGEAFVRLPHEQGCRRGDLVRREARALPHLAELRRRGRKASTAGRHLASLRGWYRFRVREGDEVEPMDLDRAAFQRNRSGPTSTPLSASVSS